MTTTSNSNNISGETLELLDRLAKRIAPKYRFPGVAVEDLEQEARIFALDALKRYQPERGKLEHYISSHLRRRLLNLRRNKFFRFECPCPSCRSCDEQGREASHHPDGRLCRLYQGWKERNQKKMALCGSREGNKKDFFDRASSDDTIGQLEIDDLVQFIAGKLNPDLHSTWGRMRAGEPYIDADKRRMVERAITRILAEAGIELALPKM